MKNVLIFIFCTIVCYQVSSQGFEGGYFGELLVENNLMVIEKNNSGYKIVLFSSKKDYIKIDAFNLEGMLNFQLPLPSGEELEVKGRILNKKLLLSFFRDNKKFSTEFTSIELPKKNPSLEFYKDSNTSEFDQRVVGRWMHIDTIDSLGYSLKGDEFVGKRYVRMFLNNGEYYEDPQLFRDFDKKHGIKSVFNYNDIPKGRWSTSNGNILSQSIGGLEFSQEYELAQDTLRLISPNGIKVIFIKK